MAQKPQPQRRSTSRDETGDHDRDEALRCSAYAADTAGVIAALKGGANVNAADPLTGLTALHLAVGTNNLALTRILIEDWKAAFMPDATGRWPTVIAAEAGVDDALSDYIVEAEAASSS